MGKFVKKKKINVKFCDFGIIYLMEVIFLLYCYLWYLYIIYGMLFVVFICCFIYNSCV